MYGVNEPSQEQKRGGPVRGLGTGTSDSIKKTVPTGSYIMPADSTQALGLNRPPVPVNLSNGEHELPPEQVHALGVQVLDQAKNATHMPVPEPRGLSRELFFANGGVVEDPLKKKQTSFDVTNTPAAPTGLQPLGSPGRAQQMQAQAQQPVTGPRGLIRPAGALSSPQPAASTPFLADRDLGAAQARRPLIQPSQEPRGLTPPAQPGTSIAQHARNVIDVPMGLVEQGAGFVAQGVGQGVDMARRSTNNVFGGAPLAEPNKYGQYGAALSADGSARAGTQLDSANAALQDGALSALGSSRAAAPTVADPTAAAMLAATSQIAPASDAGPQDQSAGNGYGAVNFDSNQYGASNNKIVGKVGANGVTEFSNNAADVSGAQGNFVAPPPRGLTRPGANPAGSTLLATGSNMPAEPRGLVAPGSSASAEPRGLVASGSAANVGNGVGTFSVAGQPGDAAKAIATYDRANAIRAETVKAAHANEPRGLTIIKDSSRAPSLADMQRARLENRQAQTADTQARGLRADRELDRNINNDQLNLQKTFLDIQSGQLGLESAQRTEQLRQQLADPNLTPDARAQLERSYRTITTPGDKRFITVPGGSDGNNGKTPSRVFDTLEQDYTDRKEVRAAEAQRRADTVQARRIIAADSSKKEEIEQRFRDIHGVDLD